MNLVDAQIDRIGEKIVAKDGPKNVLKTSHYVPGRDDSVSYATRSSCGVILN